ncbi:YitL family protein [Hoylesella saccharolytica F0055]|uniref:YitL family protein n=1 Tax=Hoylesella saccharolytica F0055 TaxID=1127699 RepID=L1N1Y8_9BACT|nr:S1-like domain-containing RNA-binding protein [Hoylesella saccharolytica]EKX97274.1 YitL family protein [Hoylesella saccharolytica F0055]
MTKIKLGDYNRLTIVKEVDFGIYLDGGDEGEILLPKRYVPENCKPGDELEVFLYLDQDERLIATTQHPLAKVGEFACLEVAWVNQYGAFLNWGLMKDLFCPFHEQKQRMEIGNRYVVAVFIDEESYRIAASAKVEHFFATDFPPYRPGEKVDLLVWQTTDLGFKVIIDHAYPGLVYRSQIFKSIRIGDSLQGYIMGVRPDGKIDVSLQPHGRQQTTDFAETLLQYLKDHDGFCELGDKSDAQDIKHRFEVSKKVYKKAIGDLYRRRLITLEDAGIRLVEAP